jgi:hypothetical protein
MMDDLPITAGTGNHILLNKVQEAFTKKYQASAAKYKGEFERAHRPGTALYQSRDAIIYWRARANLLDLDNAHRDQPTDEPKQTFQALLLLTKQTRETGGLAFADSPPPRDLIQRDPHDDTRSIATERVPSTVVEADAGDMIIWDSSVFHHGVPPPSGKTQLRLAVALAYNPPRPTPKEGSHWGYKASA